MTSPVYSPTPGVYCSGAPGRSSIRELPSLDRSRNLPRGKERTLPGHFEISMADDSVYFRTNRALTKYLNSGTECTEPVQVLPSHQAEPYSRSSRIVNILGLLEQESDSENTPELTGRLVSELKGHI